MLKEDLASLYFKFTTIRSHLHYGDFVECIASTFPFHCLQRPVMERDNKFIIIWLCLPTCFSVLKVEYDRLKNASFLTNFKLFLRDLHSFMIMCMVIQ